MAVIFTIAWRDIPSQVVAKKGRETRKVQLSSRFQEAIDRAAMRAGKGGSAAYIADWRREEPRACSDDLAMEAETAASALEAAYTDARLELLVRAKGIDTALGELAPSTPTAEKQDP